MPSDGIDVTAGVNRLIVRTLVHVVTHEPLCVACKVARGSPGILTAAVHILVVKAVPIVRHELLRRLPHIYLVYVDVVVAIGSLPEIILLLIPAQLAIFVSFKFIVLLLI